MDQKELTHPVTSKKRQVNEGRLKDVKRETFSAIERGGRNREGGEKKRGNEVEITVFSPLVHSLLELTWTLHTFFQVKCQARRRERKDWFLFTFLMERKKSEKIPEKVRRRRKKTDEDG